MKVEYKVGDVVIWPQDRRQYTIGRVKRIDGMVYIVKRFDGEEIGVMKHLIKRIGESKIEICER